MQCYRHLVRTEAGSLPQVKVRHFAQDAISSHKSIVHPFQWRC